MECQTIANSILVNCAPEPESSAGPSPWNFKASIGFRVSGLGLYNDGVKGIWGLNPY